MSRKSRKRKFYPEFYSDEEYTAIINRQTEPRPADAPETESAEAEGAEYGGKADYSEQELTEIYSRLKGTETGNKELLTDLENFKSEFIEENKKFSPFSPENPLKGVEIPETIPSVHLSSVPDAPAAEPENGGYIQYGGDNETLQTEENMSLNNSEKEINTYDAPDETGVFSGGYIDPGEFEEEESYEETDEDVTEVFEAEPEESAGALETMERMDTDAILPEEEYPASTAESLTPYDREEAVRYAHRWALDRNPAYYDYDEIGGDCTNYASQTLLAGGCKMDFTPATGWYYKSGNLKSPSWTGVEYLYNFLVGEKVAGPVGREADISEAEPGDLVQLSFNGKTYQHSPVIVKVKRNANGTVSPKDILVCAHSYDCENRPLDTYSWKKMRFIKIVGTK